MHILHTDIKSFLIMNNQHTHHSNSLPIKIILIPTSAFIFSMSEYFLTFWRLIPNQQKSQPLKLRKWHISNFLQSPKLISRKIWVTEKSWNFHTVLIQFFFVFQLSGVPKNLICTGCVVTSQGMPIYTPCSE